MREARARCPRVPRPTSRRVTRCRCPSPTASSTASSPPRCSSTSPPTSRRSRSWSGCSGPVARWRSPCRGGSRRSVCWQLSDDYHNAPGGHIRIYTDKELVDQGRRTPGWSYEGTDYAHGLHSPYWWLKCAVGVEQRRPPAGARPTTSCWCGTSSKRPRTTRWAEQGAQPADRQEPGRALLPQARCRPEIPHLPGILTRDAGRRDRGLDRGHAGAVRRRSRGRPASTPTSGTTSRPRWRCWSAARCAAAERAFEWCADHAARRRLLADEDRGRRGRGRQRRDQHLGVRRRRRVAPLAAACATAASCDRCGRPCAAASTSWSACSCRSAGIAWAQEWHDGRPGTGQPGGAAGRLVQHLPVAAGRGGAGRAGRRAAAGVGARRRPARPRAARAPRRSSSTSPRSRWTGTTRCSAARCAARPAETGSPSSWDQFVRARPRHPLRRPPTRG